MDYSDIFVDSFTSIAEANFPTIAVAANLARMDDDPVNAAVGIVGAFTPGLGIVQSIGSAFSTEPNVDGAGGTPVIAAALATLKDMQDDCGEGQPDMGGDFGSGAQKFHALSDRISGIGPPDSWQGTASDAYGQANDQQRVRADRMAQADGIVEQALQGEAGDVLDTRRVINDAISFLNTCVPIATVLSAAKMGEALSYTFQIQAVGKVLPGAISRFTELSTQVAAYVSKVAEAERVYATADTEQPGKPAGAADRLTVLPDALRARSADQRSVATDILSARETTTDAASNVGTTHGAVAAATAAAVSAAVVKRSSAADFMTAKAEKLGESLMAAAVMYERADNEQRAKLEDSFQED